jgi:hypothetical protein
VFDSTMRVLKAGKSNIKRLAYISLVRPILEYGASCRDPNRGQINPLDGVQNKVAKSANHTNDSGRKTLAQGRKRARICVLFKA